MEQTGYLARCCPAPRRSHIILQSSPHQAPKLLYINKHTRRPLRHTDRRKAPYMGLDKPHNKTDVNVLRDIVFQEQQRHDMGPVSSHGSLFGDALEHPGIFELEDTEIGIASLIPKPLAIRTKNKPNPIHSPSEYSSLLNAVESWSYSTKELASPSIKTEFSMSDRSGPSSRGSTPVSPMGSMESDHIELPPLPTTHSPPTQYRKPFESSKTHLKDPIIPIHERL
jgi:hypothetical protein